MVKKCMPGDIATAGGVERAGRMIANDAFDEIAVVKRQPAEQPLTLFRRFGGRSYDEGRQSVRDALAGAS
jgi:hypothetical protein